MFKIQFVVQFLGVCSDPRGKTDYNLAVTCDFQQCGILTSIDSDAPVQPPLKLRNSK